MLSIQLFIYKKLGIHEDELLYFSDKKFQWLSIQNAGNKY